MRKVEVEAHGVHQQGIRRGVEPQHGLAHGSPRRLIDIEAIDARTVNRRDRHRHGALVDEAA